MSPKHESTKDFSNPASHCFKDTLSPEERLSEQLKNIIFNQEYTPYGEIDSKPEQEVQKIFGESFASSIYCHLVSALRRARFGTVHASEDTDDIAKACESAKQAGIDPKILESSIKAIAAESINSLLKEVLEATKDHRVNSFDEYITYIHKNAERAGIDLQTLEKPIKETYSKCVQELLDRASRVSMHTGITAVDHKDMCIHFAIKAAMIAGIDTENLKDPIKEIDAQSVNAHLREASEDAKNGSRRLFDNIDFARKSAEKGGLVTEDFENSIKQIYSESIEPFLNKARNAAHILDINSNIGSARTSAKRAGVDLEKLEDSIKDILR